MEYDAEILIRDVNAQNAAIYKDYWTYVSSVETKKAPLYFAPYFTRAGNSEPGLKYISRVRKVQDMNLLTEGAIPDAPSDEHQQKWVEGLRLIRERAKEEGWSGNKARLFYLDPPIVFTETPVTKASWKASNPEKMITAQIPRGFSLRFDELLRAILGSGRGEP